jgi:glyoxylase I family protein
MRLQGFHHLAIQVRDVERCAAFYRDVLGLPEQVRHLAPDGRLRSIWLTVPGGGFVAIEGCEGAAEKEAFRTPRPGLHLLALRIERGDREQVERALVEKGHPIVHRTPYTLYVRDPEGNRVGLSHHPHEVA